ncbi:hypothetical protein ACIRD6_29955 [Streptomyces sp. NPDC102473]
MLATAVAVLGAVVAGAFWHKNVIRTSGLPLMSSSGASCSRP